MKKRMVVMAVVTLVANRSQASIKDVQFEPYGFIKASGNVASKGVDSFGNENLSAPTTAHLQLTENDSEARSSFQVAQSRVGTWIRSGEQLSAQLEADFIDFKLASPTTGAHPRLRVAKIVYSPNENNQFIVGQDWDVFSPMKPFTFNFVGLYFQAGNLGFMRQQAQWHYQNQNSQLSMALGMVTKNETATDTDAELALLPSLSSNYSLHLSKELELGASGILGRLEFNKAPTVLYGASAFFDFKNESLPEIKGEFYYGQNLGSASLLSVAVAPIQTVVHEAGGFISFMGMLGPSFKYLGGVGWAGVMEAEGAKQPNLTNYHIKDNTKLEIGGAYQIAKALSVYAQDSLFRTNFISDADGSSHPTISNVTELGLLFEF